MRRSFLSTTVGWLLVAGAIIFMQSPGGLAQTHGASGTQLALVVYVYDFYADWCHNCRSLEPYLRAVEARYQGRVKLVRVDIDAAENRQLVNKVGVQAVPTVLVMDANSKPIKVLLGAQEGRQLDNVLAKYFSQGGMMSATQSRLR